MANIFCSRLQTLINGRDKRRVMSEKRRPALKRTSASTDVQSGAASHLAARPAADPPADAHSPRTHRVPRASAPLTSLVAIEAATRSSFDARQRSAPALAPAAVVDALVAQAQAEADAAAPAVSPLAVSPARRSPARPRKLTRTTTCVGLFRL